MKRKLEVNHNFASQPPQNLKATKRLEIISSPKSYRRFYWIPFILPMDSGGKEIFVQREYYCLIFKGCVLQLWAFQSNLTDLCLSIGNVESSFNDHLKPFKDDVLNDRICLIIPEINVFDLKYTKCMLVKA